MDCMTTCPMMMLLTWSAYWPRNASRSPPSPSQIGDFCFAQLDSGSDPGVGDHHRIANGFPAKLKFLRGSQWSCVRCISYEEIRKQAQEALFLLSFQLLRGHFVLGKGNVDRRGRGSHLENRGQQWLIVSQTDPDVRRCPNRESVGGNGDLVISRLRGGKAWKARLG